MVLAITAVPLVVIIEGLSHSELLKTVDELDSMLRCLKFIDLLPCISCSKSVKEVAGNVRVPHDFKLDILAFNSSIVDVEGIVALHLGQLHETLHVHVSGVTHGAVVCSLLTGVDAWLVVRADIHKVEPVRHILEVCNVSVIRFSLTVNQAREAHLELLLESQFVVVSSGKGSILIPASWSVGESRQVFA